MREIKFRAWKYNNQNNTYKMEYSPIIYDDECFGEVSMVRMNEAIKRGGAADFDMKDIMIFMQYTGLKDKNGKEIYEGDIVKGINLENFFWVEPVTFIDNGWFPFIEHREMTDFEVIGNIYENPNLLKESEGK